MKYLLSALLLLLFLPVLVKGQQNHVPNGSFEGYTSCPSNLGQLSRCLGWYQYTTGGNPDYYRTCGTGVSGVPINYTGYQQPVQGNAYIGLVSYEPAGPSWYNYKEYAACQITPLQQGTTYEVSMSVNLATKSRHACDDLGVFFFLNSPTTQNGGLVLGVTPQISYSSYGPIIDTQNWVRVTKTFTADSAYKYIVIGGFKSYNTLNIDTVNPTGGVLAAYYLIDSVVIRPLHIFYYNINDSLLCAGDTFSLQYYTNSPYNSGNIFTVQLSNSSGSFSNPLNIGSITSHTSGTILCSIPTNISQGNGYRIRVIASTPNDTSTNISPIIKIGNIDSTTIYIGSNSPLCEGSTLQLSSSTFISGTTYNWTGPGNFNSSSASPTISGVAALQNGDYIVTVKWYGCEVKDTLSVTVKPLPAKPVAINNSPLCAGDSLHLSSTSSTGGVTFSWTGPGSFSSAVQDTSIANSTTAMSGDYIVTNNLNGCNRKDTTTVLVKPMPAAVTASNNGPLCAGDTLHLSSTASTTGSTYSWTGPGSFSATTQNTNRVNTTAGMTGWYKMLVDLNGCSFVDSTYATVYPIPAMPNINYSNPLCIGETLNLGTATVSGATYSWTGPGNYSSALQNPVRSNMQFGDTGSYKLHITVNGCGSDTATATVKINPQPFVVIFPTPGDSICVGDRVNFTALPNNHGGTPAYQWYVNGQASGTGTIFSTTTLNDQDIVRCDMTENSKCNAPYTDPSNDITMNVLPWLAPSVSISANPNRPLKENEYVTFTATATNAGNNPQYQWKRNGQNIVGATGAVWSANTLSDNDNISVAIISNYKCPQPTSAVSNTIVVQVLTGVAGLNEINGLVLYPNPNNGKFVLKGRLNTREIAKLEVINTVGKVVFEDTAITESGNIYHEIALPCVPPGIYMLRIKASEQLAVFKVEVR